MNMLLTCLLAFVICSPKWLSDKPAAPSVAGAKGEALGAYQLERHMEIEEPHEHFALLKEARVALNMNFIPTKIITVSQRMPYPPNPKISQLIDGSLARVPVETGPDGHHYIRVKPIRLGKMRLEVIAYQPDEEDVVADRDIEVFPSGIQPLELVGEDCGRNWESGEIPMTMGKVFHYGFLGICAKFAGYDRYVPILGQYVHFTVTSPHGAS